MMKMSSIDHKTLWETAFSHFPTMFSKGPFLTVIKSQDCALKNYQSTIEGPFGMQEIDQWQKVLTHVSLHGLCRVTCVDTSCRCIKTPSYDMIHLYSCFKSLHKRQYF